MFNLFKKKDSSPIHEDERIAYLQEKEIDNYVISYISQLLNGLKIDIMSLYNGRILDLMSQNKLIGWCWQTAETASIFFDDNDYVERGYLFLDPHRQEYFHSWIAFTFNNNQYIFDPCLNIICERYDFFRIFQVKTVSRIKTKVIKNSLKSRIDYNSEKNTDYEILIPGTEDINGPFFRGTRKYDININKKKILNLHALFYDRNY